MKERFIEISPDADEKQEERFNIWRSGEGIPFVDNDTKAAYQERVTLIKDAIQLKKKPSRIPVCPSPSCFPIQNSKITMYEAMYNYEALTKVIEEYQDEFMTDVYNGPASLVSGKMLDILDFKLFAWAGHGVAKEQEYQFVEDEYMKAEEYQDLIDDPTAFFQNSYFPRIFGALTGLQKYPVLPIVHEILCVPPAVIPFSDEDMKSALQALMKAGDEALRFRTAVGKLSRNIMGKKGIPAFGGGFTKAPFDTIGDSLRGTKGVMLDIFRCPDELKEACERLTPIMVKAGVNACRASGHLMPLIPLHKGADGFLSDEQFQTFYWPTLRKLIIGLINEGMVPHLFAEGSYNQRLDIISDLPKGKALWLFDRTDMVKAKETVGRVACISGNFPIDLLITGTPDEVRAHCKQLIESVGKNGGYIFATGAGMSGAKAANVKAMIEAAKEYGASNT
ncbi:MAG: uroporphyrinogen decarboxylase [Deltaproteobacteria bacterium]|nr:uroporphyrinogen decarboxylase [Deltaproteobacteria bacterium]